VKLWIDADAAPRDVKDLCFRTSDRLKLATILVANQRIQLPLGYTHLSAASTADRTSRICTLPSTPKKVMSL
jgi:uncharacterized protein YaiI (UPF0178 family)